MKYYWEHISDYCFILNLVMTNQVFSSNISIL